MAILLVKTGNFNSGTLWILQQCVIISGTVEALPKHDDEPDHTVYIYMYCIFTTSDIIQHQAKLYTYTVQCISSEMSATYYLPFMAHMQNNISIL